MVQSPMFGVMFGGWLLAPRRENNFYIIDADTLGVFGDGVLDGASIRIDMNTGPVVSIGHLGHVLEFIVCEATRITLEGNIEAMLDNQPIGSTALVGVSNEPHRLKITRGDRVLYLEFFIGYDYPVSWRNRVLGCAPFGLTA